MNDQPKLPGVVGARPLAIVPTSFDEIWRMGNMLSQTQMVPEAFRGKPNDCTAAIMAGLELGLSPMAALQSIAVVNGRPALWGDGLMAVVRASGLLEWIKEEDDGNRATCTVKRRGEPDPVVRTFSQTQAALAGLSGKGVWKQYPERMRTMRARSWALRDTFADVLRGIASVEEMQDVEMRDITPAAAPTQALPTVDQLFDDAAPEAPPADSDEEFLARFKQSIEINRGDEDTLKALWDASADEIAARGLEQACSDLMHAETVAAEPETVAASPDPEVERKLATFEKQLAMTPNLTRLRDCVRSWEPYVSGLPAVTQAKFQAAHAAATARLKVAAMNGARP